MRRPQERARIGNWVAFYTVHAGTTGEALFIGAAVSQKRYAFVCLALGLLFVFGRIICLLYLLGFLVLYLHTIHPFSHPHWRHFFVLNAMNDPRPRTRSIRFGANK